MGQILETIAGQFIPVVADGILSVTPDNNDVIRDGNGKGVKGILKADGADVTVTVDTKFNTNVGPITIKDGQYLDVIVTKVYVTGTSITGATLWLYY